MALRFRVCPRALVVLVLLAQAFLLAWAGRDAPSTGAGALTLDQLNADLQECAVVRDLAARRAPAAGAPARPESAAAIPSVLGLLFPSASPAVNALLATVYISGPPNLLLALCPPDVDPSALSVMVAFAVGGLLGDTLFHLLPEIFVGEADPDQARIRFVLVEPRRNLVLGVGILVGFLTFVAMDKGLRIGTGAGAGAGGAHAHGHGHGHGGGGQEQEGGGGRSTALGEKEAAGHEMAVRKRSTKGDAAPQAASPDPPLSQSVKLGGYLNLIADFTHNITDGLAMSASFYASPAVGATTALAVFFHEIPHEVGDFALLVQSGFSKRAAMGAQFITAVGALLGTLIGIAVQELGGAGGEPVGIGEGIFGTSLTWGDMLLPFTAGTFLYVGTVAVIPDLLETGPDRAAELKKMAVQFLAILLGAGIMLFISWQE